MTLTPTYFATYAKLNFGKLDHYKRLIIIIKNTITYYDNLNICCVSSDNNVCNNNTLILIQNRVSYKLITLKSRKYHNYNDLRLNEACICFKIFILYIWCMLTSNYAYYMMIRIRQLNLCILLLSLLLYYNIIILYLEWPHRQCGWLACWRLEGSRLNPGCIWAAPIYTTHNSLRGYCPWG